MEGAGKGVVSGSELPQVERAVRGVIVGSACRPLASKALDAHETDTLFASSRLKLRM